MLETACFVALPDLECNWTDLDDIKMKGDKSEAKEWSDPTPVKS